MDAISSGHNKWTYPFTEWSREFSHHDLAIDGEGRSVLTHSLCKHLGQTMMLAHLHVNTMLLTL